MEASNELILRRVMYTDGRSRAFINGLAATVGQLKELGELLVDIYSQNAHHSLLKPATQREILDQFGGYAELAKQVSSHYKTWHHLHLQRVEAEKHASEYANELAELRDQVRELSQIALAPAEWEELQQEHLRLSNSASLITGGEECRELLSEGELSALRMLSQIQHKLQNLQ